MQRTLDRIVAPTRSFCGDQVFGEDDAYQVVLIVIIGTQHRQTTELVFDDDIDRLTNSQVVVDRHDIGTWHHNFAHHGVTKLNYRFNQLTLFVLNH